MNLQILVKFSPPGLILDIAFFDFAAFLNYKNFNTTLCLEGFHPQFAVYFILNFAAIKQKYICHPNKCLSDLFYLGIQKYLGKQTKQGTFWICIWTYTIHSFKTTK